MPAGSAPEFRYQGQILAGLLGHSATADAALIVNLLVDGGNFAHAVIQYHRQLVAHVRAGESGELSSTLIGQN